MDAKQAAEVLERHNRWRRGDDSVPETDPKELGLAIETVVAAIKAQRELCRHVHDRLLRGDSDSRLLKMLSVGYGPGPYIIPDDEEPQPVAALKAQSEPGVVEFRYRPEFADGFKGNWTSWSEVAGSGLSVEGIKNAIANGQGYELRTVYAAPQPTSAAVPDEWQLVPIQPTPEMLTAWNEARTREAWSQDSRPDYAAPYRAMLAAAPAAGGGESNQGESDG